jgi:hypothetical protein
LRSARRCRPASGPHNQWLVAFIGLSAAPHSRCARSIRAAALAALATADVTAARIKVSGIESCFAIADA